MKTIFKPSPEELKTILENHKHWLNEDCENWISLRADLRGADLSEADLREANLRRANLCRANFYGANLLGADLCGADLCEADLCGANLLGADLREADLRRANLYGADLRGANLLGADLCGADLYGANLYGADLRGADLYGANLCRANLCEADLRGADLRGADLSEADLCGANFRGADLCRANLYGANLYGADLFVPIVCPSHGSFTAWKKCANNTLVKLLIPEDAKRFSAFGRKCRSDKAEVIAIYDIANSEPDEKWKEIEETRSIYNPNFVYRVGETVIPDSYDDNRWNECSNGIHFFITAEEACRYNA